MLEVATLVVEGLALCTTFAMEGIHRSKSKESQRLLTALQTFDQRALERPTGDVKLASFMRGQVTAKTVKKVLESRETRSLMTEILLASMIDGAADSLATALTAMQRHLSTQLQHSASERDADFFSEQFVAELEQATADAVRHVRDSDPLALTALQQVGVLRRIAAVLSNIDDHARAIARRADAHEEAQRDKFVGDYRKACIERHGYINPPDFETLRKVPAEQLYVAPSLRPKSISIESRSQTVEEFADTFDRAVVLGDPGGGKSTLSNYIATYFARRAERAIPFHITLRLFAPLSSTLSVLEYIEQHLKPQYQVAAPDDTVYDLLAGGNAVVIFDGLDELIDTTQRREVTRIVEIFGMMFPLVPVMVTSRRIGYDQAQLDDAVFTTYFIDEFSPTQVTKYVGKWFGCQRDYTPEQADSAAVECVAQTAAVPDLRANPLMLSLMCILFRSDQYIPRNRPAIYEKCANLLFDKWDGHRGIEVPLKARDHLNAAMKYMAFRFLESNSGDNGIERGALVQMLTEYLTGRAFDEEESAASAADEFVDYCHGRAWVFTDAGSTADGSALYTFTHRTFMEYFAAVHLTRIEHSPESLAQRLLPRVSRQEWDVVAQLAVQQIDSRDRGTELVLQAMLDDRRKRSFENRANVLSFVARCTEFAVIPPALLERIASASLMYALTGDVHSVKAWSAAMSPLWALEQAHVDSEARIVTDVYERVLIKELECASPELRAAEFALDYLSNIQFRSLEPESELDQFDRAIVHVAHMSSAPLLTSAERNPRYAPVLAWHGIVPIDDAIGVLARNGHDVAKCYLRADSDPLGARQLSIAEWLIRSASVRWSLHKTKQQAAVRAVARQMVGDFMREGNMQRASIHRRMMYRLFIDPAIDVGHLPRVVVDAVLVIFMATVEVLAPPRVAGDFRADFGSQWLGSDRSLSFDLLTKAASSDVAVVANRWINNEYNVFVRETADIREVRH